MIWIIIGKLSVVGGMHTNRVGKVVRPEPLTVEPVNSSCLHKDWYPRCSSAEISVLDSMSQLQSGHCDKSKYSPILLATNWRHRLPENHSGEFRDSQRRRKLKWFFPTVNSQLCKVSNEFRKLRTPRSTAEFEVLPRYSRSGLVFGAHSC